MHWLSSIIRNIKQCLCEDTQISKIYMFQIIYSKQFKHEILKNANNVIINKSTVKMFAIDWLSNVTMFTSHVTCDPQNCYAERCQKPDPRVRATQLGLLRTVARATSWSLRHVNRYRRQKSEAVAIRLTSRNVHVFLY